MAYVDGELAPSQAALVETHLFECRACQKIVGDLRQVSRDLAQWAIEAPPLRPAPRVRSGARQWLQSLMALQLRPIAQVAAVGIVLIVGTSLWVHREFEASLNWTSPRGARPVKATAQAETVERESAGHGGGGAGGGNQRRPAPAALEPRLGSAGQPSDAGRRASAQQPEATPESHVIRTASLMIVTKSFDTVRPTIERMLREAGGFVGHIQVSGGRGDARTLTATLRVPSSRLDATLATLRTLGQAMDESQGGEDVTTQMIDLDARLRNSRNTESRLTDVLKNRTGRIADVLEVEREIARVREEIEQLDAQRKQMQDRVTYATVSLTVTEEKQAQIDTGPSSIGIQLRNAFVEGLQHGYENAAGALLMLLRVAPVLAFWGIVLWWPVRRAVRAVRNAPPQPLR